MSRRNKILIVITILIILAILILLFFLYIKKSPTVVTGEKETPTLPKVQNLTPRTSEAPKSSPEDLARQTIEALARAFAERFGSFSNQSGYLNIVDLRPLMTPSTEKWANDSYIPKLKVENPLDGPFYGISTRTINVQSVKIVDADHAEAVVATQREETKGMSASRIFYQDVELKFLRLNASWLVDWVKWL